MNKLWYFENSLPLELLTLTFARDELMFSMFSMLPMQLFCTLLQARRMKSQKLRWPSNQLPAPITEENKMCTTIHFHTYWFHWYNCKEECFRLFYLFIYFTFKAVAEDVLENGGKIDEFLWGVVDWFCRILLQQGLHRKPASQKDTMTISHTVRWEYIYVLWPASLYVCYNSSLMDKE